ncbi:hypothetical protein CA267_007700 [Alteromonas pelagimontana]|uniref:Lipoprotein n=1 Tax=Alteromonas pelagimontana TaxID=1858656 RepID=A0A6M4MC02_9ALTE|nr:hypothetical protein [Alteromonas pelagimontana]QJR80673.1 hypothetical protein CA267_007700 [Alteromonas pelagimontana]
MIKILILLLATLSISSCSQRPSYKSMQENFIAHKATFIMIAKMACDIGKEQSVSRYSLEGQSEREDVVLELADTLGINSITYQKKSENCTLLMPVWEDDSTEIQQQFAYRYNISEPRHFDAEFHQYDAIASRISEGKADEVAFDMKLAKRWFFSLLYRSKLHRSVAN